MSKLSLAIIIKDEAESLKRCLNSIIDYVDEVIVVANKPATKEIKALQTDFPKMKLFERQWNDNFAEARNFSFEKCANDYIVWLDGDDTVVNADKIPKLVEKMAKQGIDWCDIEYIYARDDQDRVTMRQWKPRIMRKGSGKWVAPIHESFLAEKAIRQIRDEYIKIEHHRTKEGGEQSGERNLRILLQEFNRDQDKTDPRTIYYLANTLMGMGKQEEAIPFYQMHIAKCGWAEEKYFSMHYLAQCLRFVGRVEEAINVSLESLKIFPQWSLAYFDIGEHYGVKENWRQCIEWTLTGLEKETPDPSVYFVSDVDYDVNPYGRLAEAYLQVHEFKKAYAVAFKLRDRWPNDPVIKELYDTCNKIRQTEHFIEAFTNVAGFVRDRDRLKAVKLFEAIPSGMDNDIRLQTIRQQIVPPKVWGKNSIVIYCHPGYDEWAYPSLFTGIGGSEEAVIHMSNQLTSLGYKVTIFNKCGSLEGEYRGVAYKPFYHFNPLDQFDVLVVWRYPGFLAENLKARKKFLWLHDIVHKTLFNDDIIRNVDKILFLSKWHRNNVPELPEEKVYLTNNGIDPKQFEGLDWSKKRPSSLVYTSSYDRGLICLGRDILPLIEKEIPDLTLDVAYGTGNLEKDSIEFPHLKEIYNEAQKLFKKPNITHHGRISHKEVADLQCQAMVHAYASEFGETCNISSMKAQAAGAYVITTSQAGATQERVRFGKVIQGNGIYSDPKLRQQYANEVIKFLKNPVVLSEEERQKIINEFSWESTAKAWQKDLLND